MKAQPNRQVVGNIGMYFAAYQLSLRGWNVMPTDFLDQKTYRLADGSTVPSQTFRIRSLKVGNKVIENVNGSVASVKGTLLLVRVFFNPSAMARSDVAPDSRSALIVGAISAARTAARLVGFGQYQN